MIRTQALTGLKPSYIRVQSVHVKHCQQGEGTFNSAPNVGGFSTSAIVANGRTDSSSTEEPHQAHSHF